MNGSFEKGSDWGLLSEHHWVGNVAAFIVVLGCSFWWWGYVVVLHGDVGGRVFCGWGEDAFESGFVLQVLCVGVGFGLECGCQVS